MIPIDILPVEDHVGEIHITTEALQEGNLINDINIVRADLIDFLRVSTSIKDFWIPIVQLPKNNSLVYAI